jgi:hypothetical protein
MEPTLIFAPGHFAGCSARTAQDWPKRLSLRRRWVIDSAQSLYPLSFSPYLGADHPKWRGAVCPTCHRNIHHGVDGAPQ